MQDEPGSTPDPLTTCIKLSEKGLDKAQSARLRRHPIRRLAAWRIVRLPPSFDRGFRHPAVIRSERRDQLAVSAVNVLADLQFAGVVDEGGLIRQMHRQLRLKLNV